MIGPPCRSFGRREGVPHPVSGPNGAFLWIIRGGIIIDFFYSPFADNPLKVTFALPFGGSAGQPVGLVLF